MTQDEVAEIVLSCDAGFREGTHQKQRNQVRFFGPRPEKSINIGYSSPRGVFVADFVFMGGTPQQNETRAKAFLSLFGGEIPSRPTVFARLEPSFAEAEQLKRLIQAYAAIKPVAGA